MLLCQGSKRFQISSPCRKSGGGTCRALGNVVRFLAGPACSHRKIYHNILLLLRYYFYYIFQGLPSPSPFLPSTSSQDLDFLPPLTQGIIKTNKPTPPQTARTRQRAAYNTPGGTRQSLTGDAESVEHRNAGDAGVPKRKHRQRIPFHIHLFVVVVGTWSRGWVLGIRLIISCCIYHMV